MQDPWHTYIHAMQAAMLSANSMRLQANIKGIAINRYSRSDKARYARYKLVVVRNHLLL